MHVFSLVMVIVLVIAFVMGLWKGKRYLELPMWQQLAISLPVFAAVFIWIWLLNREAQKVEPVWATGEKAIHWDAVPVAVYPEPDVAGESFDEAISLWNRAVKCPLLIQVKDAGSAQIVASRGAVDDKLAGRTDKDSSGRVFVQLLQPGNVTHEYLIWAHELGRALGLATDPSKRSVMANGVQTQDIGNLPQVSRKDAEALADRYCSR